MSCEIIFISHKVKYMMLCIITGNCLIIFIPIIFTAGQQVKKLNFKIKDAYGIINYISKHLQTWYIREFKIGFIFDFQVIFVNLHNHIMQFSH